MISFVSLIRTVLFTIAFYLVVAAECIFFLPGLLLPKEKQLFIVMFFVRSVHWMEKFILGLDYEVRGLEHIPENGAFIIAAKHQSPYETMKLNLLFDNPAIILKQELLNIPLWGRYLKIVDPIAIDRKEGKKAVEQILDGARRVRDQERPIVIFPQGTRVYSWQDTKEKPYKVGVVRMHFNTGLPVVPMALNTGLYWPRKSWRQYPGKVVFEFLPPIEANDTNTFMANLETKLEDASQKLTKEALANYPYLKKNAQRKAT